MIDNELTYEEFMELSKNPPQWEGETLFNLTIVTIDKYQRRRYPKYDVCEYSQGFYHTREEAEQFMRQNTTGKDEFGNRIYCYYLYEYPYALVFKVREYVSCHVYDAYGQLTEQTLCSDLWRENLDCNIFFGRAAEKVRFKEGEIVEVLDLYNDRVSLAVMVHPPLSPEEAWRFCSRMKEHTTNFSLDASDDWCTVIDGPSYMSGHYHVPTTSIFAPHFKIPDKIRQRFEGYYKEILKERESHDGKQ